MFLAVKMYFFTNSFLELFSNCQAFFSVINVFKTRFINFQCFETCRDIFFKKILFTVSFCSGYSYIFFWTRPFDSRRRVRAVSEELLRALMVVPLLKYHFSKRNASFLMIPAFVPPALKLCGKQCWMVEKQPKK